MDPATGTVTEVELFVAVLGASSYTYAEATRSQRAPDWIGSHCRAFAFFGGVPRRRVRPAQERRQTRLPVRASREHMPSAHPAHAEWTPSRLLAWAEKIGPATQQLCAAILAERPHPEQGFRSCLSLLRLGKRYGQERLEAACVRAGYVRARSYRHVESILKNGLDRVPLAHDAGAPVAPQPIDHENIRGRDYYLN